jgi:hypothetical protein
VWKSQVLGRKEKPSGRGAPVSYVNCRLTRSHINIIHSSPSTNHSVGLFNICLYVCVCAWPKLVRPHWLERMSRHSARSAYLRSSKHYICGCCCSSSDSSRLPWRLLPPRIRSAQAANAPSCPIETGKMADGSA